MEMVTKYFRSEIKSIDEENHTVLAVISDQTVDSYRDIIDANGWIKHLSRFKKHPVLLSSHNYGDLRKQIGIAEKVFVKDDALMASLKYFVDEGNEEADWAWNLAKKKIAAYSVGFRSLAMRYWNEMTEDEQKEARQKYKIPKKINPFRIYLEQELLENSQVVIPANPNALQDSLNDKELVVRKTAEDLSVMVKEEADTKAKADKEEIENKLWEDEEDWKEIRYRVKNPDLFVRIRRKKMPGVTPPIHMLVGPLKSDPDGGTKIQSLRFPKPAWTLAKAKAWIKEHPDIKKKFEEWEDAIAKEPAKFEDIEDKELLEQFPEPKEPAKEVDEELVRVLCKTVREAIETSLGVMVKSFSELGELIKTSTKKAPADSGVKPKETPQEGDIYAEVIIEGQKTLQELKKGGESK